MQEALTNVLKHAGPRARERASSATSPSALRLEVVDDGRGVNGRVRPGGHGLMGMRERVGVYGGTFEAGPQSGGGFRVVGAPALRGGRSDPGRGRRRPGARAQRLRRAVAVGRRHRGRRRGRRTGEKPSSSCGVSGPTWCLMDIRMPEMDGLEATRADRPTTRPRRRAC